tara:strand:- start:1 stop:267 length:267 start_codon:yes stop_codon:yes gene_type:complete
MNEISDLKQKIKVILIEELMLHEEPAEIDDATPLFGEGLGLDSVDALQLVVALEKHFGLKVDDAEKAKRILHNVESIAEAINENVPAG